MVHLPQNNRKKRHGFHSAAGAAAKQKRITSIDHVGTALQSRPARAILRLEIRTGLETRPHMFFNFKSTSRERHARIKAC